MGTNITSEGYKLYILLKLYDFSTKETYTLSDIDYYFNENRYPNSSVRTFLKYLIERRALLTVITSAQHPRYKINRDILWDEIVKNELFTITKIWLKQNAILYGVD